ncbi:hypothetical protein F935_03452 [Acinetobacter calcoaceticus ANC 3811]|uniref:Tyr recombinase domain-containing protein n=1 Tax=Acinetobacter calcoaceticus ANC 3811 TaxID=1217690 RepID=R8XW95_ACICA|nr:hypothetical protein [Acinetobacter calcoaceticus]EOQ61106.1 hypothetical protein F935_03452 [Acinetobacter calcoaceticus ANC 3811]
MENNFLFLSYVLPVEYQKNYPTNKTGITFNSNGTILSYFKDNIWDFTPYLYRPTIANKIDFNNIILEDSNKNLKNLLIFQAKLLVYGLMFCNTNSRSISASSIFSYYFNIRILVRIAYQNKFSLDNLSSNNKFTSYVFKYFRNKKRRVFSFFITTLKKISRLSVTFTEHNFSISPSQFNELTSFKDKLLSNEIKQHLVIPTRIYAILIKKQEQIFNEYLKYRYKFLHIFRIVFDNDFRQTLKLSYRNIWSYVFDRIKFFGLEEIAKKYKINNMFNLKKYYYSLMELTKLSILLFSGMRMSECLLLPFNALNKILIKNTQVFILNGYTSKFTKIGPMKTVWICSSAVEIAIKVAQEMVKISTFISKIQTKDYSQFPIFYAPKGGTKTNIYKYSVQNKIDFIPTIKFFNLDLNICEYDLEEMKRIELLSDLHERKVKINQPFPLSAHQFRRSLTVYASRSGLVQTPALKGQLKHITEEMTYYYGNNSHLIPNYIFDQTLIDTFNEEKFMESLLSFKEDIIDTEIPLFGAEGTRLQNAKETGNVPLFLTDFKHTEQAIRDGRLSYRRTPLGGCARKEHCDKTAFISITACISCKDAVFSSKSIKALEKTKYHFMSRSFPLNHDDPYKKQLLCEVREIDSILLKYKNRIGVKNVTEIDE